MAGLLDFLNTDDGKLGIALLSAAGPSMQPIGFGQRLQGAMQTVQEDKKNQAQLGLLSAQLGEYATKNQLEQFQLQRMKDWQAMINGGGSPAAAPQVQPQPQIGTANSIGGVIPQFSGPLTTTTPAAPQGQPTQSQSGGFPFPLRGMSDVQTRAIAGSMTPEKYMELYATQSAPQTDIEKLMAAQGISKDSALGRQLLQQATAKANNIPLVAGRAGAPMYNPDGSIAAMAPKIPDNAIPQIVGGRVVGVSALPGASQIEQLNAYAGAAGKAQTKPITAFRGNQPVFTNELDASQGGAFSGMPSPQPGVTGAFSGKPEDVIGAIAAIKDPQERANALQAFQTQMLQGGGQLTPQPTLGTTANADAAQTASAKTMKASYEKLQSANASAQAAIEAIDKMRALAERKWAIQAGPLGTATTAISPDAAEYEKQRANLIAQLSQQNGTGATDAGRALTGQSVPDYGKPKPAIADGLGTLRNQTVLQQLKTSVLTPVYQSGDSKAYTTLENEFDQHVSPSMVPLLTMPAGKFRAGALATAAKDPAMRAKLNWAAEHGLLK